MSAIAIVPVSQRYGRVGALSTARNRHVAGAEAVKDFIILTDFSRCQGNVIGRVSRRPQNSPKGLFMTFPFPATKTGLRLASAAVAGCLAMALLAGTSARADDANPVLAKVNGSEIRQSDVALAEEELGPSLDKMDPATKQENLLAFLIDMKIVSKAAEDKKVENNEEFKKRLAFTRNRLLMDSLLATEGKAATTDEAMKKVYDDASKQITGEQEVNPRHILVETEDEAKAVKAALDTAADFAELAKKKSKDPGAAD